MPIEKAFAMRASPDAIFAAIERDLASASTHEGDTFEVLRRDPPSSIDLRVTIGNIPCRLRYRLTPREEFTEVAATIQPYGWRYTAFRIMTLGLREQGFAVALVESLSNLKAAVESGADEERAEK